MKCPLGISNFLEEISSLSLSVDFLYFFFPLLLAFLKEMGIPDHLTCWVRNVYAGQEATVRTGHATTCLVTNMTGSKSGKEYIKAVYSHPAYLTYIQCFQWSCIDVRVEL